MAEFEKEVIREVKAKGPLCGYITAEYGHGNTSTALYLWQHACNADPLTAPLQLKKQTVLIHAPYGQACFDISHKQRVATAR